MDMVGWRVEMTSGSVRKQTSKTMSLARLATFSVVWLVVVGNVMARGDCDERYGYLRTRWT